MQCDFSFKHYREILACSKKHGFVFTSFRDFGKNKKQEKLIILRHDVDYLPQRAYELAKIEKNLGIESTYFIRVHGEYYNPFDERSFKIIQSIKKLGHEIGLHFESGYLARNFGLDETVLFLKEKKILEDIFDLKINSASEHAYLGRSASFWKKHFFTRVKKEKVGIKHFPQEEVFKEFHYLSDSCARWKEGCLCQNLEKYDKIQILIHGDHWGKDAKQEIRKLIKTYANL